LVFLGRRGVGFSCCAPEGFNSGRHRNKNVPQKPDTTNPTTAKKYFRGIRINGKPPVPTDPPPPDIQ